MEIHFHSLIYIRFQVQMYLGPKALLTFSTREASSGKTRFAVFLKLETWRRHKARSEQTSMGDKYGEKKAEHWLFLPRHIVALTSLLLIVPKARKGHLPPHPLAPMWRRPCFRQVNHCSHRHYSKPPPFTKGKWQAISFVKFWSSKN